MRMSVCKRRRPTTLPAPAPAVSPLLMVNAAMKEAYTRQIYGGPTLLSFQPDPWDEAVKWIEQRKADEKEWPWPS
jgi:hypothetical protein